MGFGRNFSQWLNESLSVKIPSSVTAFSFNLYEPAGIPSVKFGIELIGASEFDRDDSD